MMKPNTKTAGALSIAVFTIITIAAYGTISTLESTNLLAETTQYPLSPVQAAYGIAAALIALSAIVLMFIREKNKAVSPETIW